MNRSLHPWMGTALMLLVLAGLACSVLDVVAEFFFVHVGSNAAASLEIGFSSSDYSALARQPQARMAFIAALSTSALGRVLPWIALIRLGFGLYAHPAISRATGNAFRVLSWSLVAYAALQAISIGLLLAWQRQDELTSLDLDSNGLFITGITVATAWCVTRLLAHALDVSPESEGIA